MLQGKVYSCEDYYLMLYPDKTTAQGDVHAHHRAVATTVGLHNHASYTEKNIPILVLNREGEYIEVLAGDRKGWIVFKDRLNLKEIK